ncbi:MAG: hypothetical protein IJV69_00745 [Kiritimatiellae bacterium]|nr:hypothetical protein [Kiritimatiellia bacterium]
MRYTLLLLASLFILPKLYATLAFAYHGSLKEANGADFNLSTWNNRPETERTFIFALYNVPTSGEALWSVTFSGAEGIVIPDANGIFTVDLNDGIARDGTPATFFDILSQNDTTSLYLGITVGEGTQELSPRQQILTVPYAASALYAEGDAQNFSVAGTTSTTDLIANEVRVTDIQVTHDTTVSNEMTVTHVETETLTITQAATFMDDVTATTISGAGTIPIGGIVPFFGADIPNGWALCDGTNGTPNLTDYFIIGADGGSYPTGATGGASNVTLKAENLPSHTHSHTRKIYSSLYNFWGEERDSGWDRWSQRNTVTRTSSSGDSLSSSPKSFSILPPYVYLRYIMRTQ